MRHIHDDKNNVANSPEIFQWLKMGHKDSVTYVQK